MLASGVRRLNEVVYVKETGRGEGLFLGRGNEPTGVAAHDGLY